MAVESRAMVSIVGERGMGKTRAVRAALDKIGCKIVLVEKSQKERLTISDIEQAIILDLSDEPPKRGGEVRARQLRRIVGEASRKQKIVVVIEEAHRLHGQTLRSLKTLREIQWMGNTELFTVVLIGQSDPMNKAGVSEVRLRTDCIRMQGMTAVEAGEYTSVTLGKFFDDEALEAVSRLPQATNYLELQALLVELLNYAIAGGRDQVNKQDVNDVAGHLQPARPKTKAKVGTCGNDALKSVLATHKGGDLVSLRPAV
jgi:type II secretory pathway predicted ATPase ExeA